MIDEINLRPNAEGGDRRPTARVIIVDDHPSYAQGLATLLTKLGDIEVVSIAYEPEEALAATEAHQPDVVLMDIRLPERTGIEATREIRTRFPDVKVAVLTASTDASDVQEAMKAGACGYLLKQSDAGDLVAGISAIHAGKTVIEASVLSSLERHERESLSERDLQLLKLLAKGLELSSIAREMSVSESTVKRHVVQVQQKLGVENRIQAVVAAATRGLL